MITPKIYIHKKTFKFHFFILSHTFYFILAECVPIKTATVMMYIILLTSPLSYFRKTTRAVARSNAYEAEESGWSC